MKIWGNIFTMAFIVAIVLIGYSHNVFGTCRWDGTAPYCAGECGVGETEEARASTDPNFPPFSYGQPAVNNFGQPCVFGTKAYCCKTPGITCRWDGTAPFCDGECEADENLVEACASCSGKTCWTGYKVKCCKSDPGSAGQPLKASAEDARYAAIWEKKSGPAWVARHGMTSAKYQKEFNKLGDLGYRLVHVSGYGVGGRPYYAAIWEKKPGPAWVARHGMISDSYQEQFNYLAKEGYRLSLVSGFYAY